MKKRLFACLIAACLAVSVLVLPASAARLNNSAIQTAITLGAMDTSQTGSLDAAVTRGAFAKMLVSFSAYRESASQQGNLGTLYKDVPGSSQWAPYVRIAVQQGWMNGYTDGTFRPDNAVTLEEACTAALKLLGYKMTDLNGVFPTAQLNKAQELGLRNQLNRSQSEAMNYEDCALLLYNTLTANTASGSAYGTSLGFTVSNGQVDTSTVLLSSLKGPFVASEGTQLPFAPVSVYRNDKVSESGELKKYDVYEKAITRQRRELEKVNRKFSELYGDYSEHLINESEYLTLKQQYLLKSEALKKEIDNLLISQNLYSKNYKIDEDWENLINKYLKCRKLNKELADAFVDKVQVFEGGRISVNLVYDDCLEELLQVKNKREGDLNE